MAQQTAPKNPYYRFSERVNDGLNWIGQRVDNLSVLGILIGAAFFVTWTSARFIAPPTAPDAPPVTVERNDWWEGFWQNFGTELFGAFITFLLIENIVGSRNRAADAENLRQLLAQTQQQNEAFLLAQQNQLDQQERAAQVSQLSSRVPGFAAEAVRLLKHHDDQLGDEAIGMGDWWFSGDLVAEALQNEGNFELADLREVDLVGQEIPGARLSKADLRGAHLQGANLGGAQLQGADLFGAQLQGAGLGEAQLQGADLRRAQLQGADLVMAQLQGATLLRAQLQEADLSGAQLQEAGLGRARLLEANQWRAQLQGADLGSADLQGADLFRAQLQGADLRRAHLQGADLWQAQLQEANLMGAQLQGATLRDAQLQRARTLARAVLPDGTLARAVRPDGTRLPLDGWEQAFTRWAAYLRAAGRLRPAERRQWDAEKGELTEETRAEQAIRVPGLLVNLAGVHGVTREELERAPSLGDCTLPDGTELPPDDWQAPFAAWVARLEAADRLYPVRPVRPAWDEEAGRWVLRPAGDAVEHVVGLG
ncbi:MAG: pentapeptide repeat-containing protein [Anaerolineae bacterium]